jgi:hypothetical protein
LLGQRDCEEDVMASRDTQDKILADFINKGPNRFQIHPEGWGVIIVLIVVAGLGASQYFGFF